MKIKKNGDVWHYWCPGCDCAHGINSTWQFNGDVEKPTISPSILATGAGTCHCFIKDGKIQFLDDCTHALKGQTVDVPEWPFKD
jgi:hypothetical protein